MTSPAALDGLSIIEELDAALSRIEAHHLLVGLAAEHEPVRRGHRITASSLNGFAPRPRIYTVNDALLQEALDYITEHPEEHDSAVWAKHTPNGDVVGCTAYHVARLTGHPIDWSKAANGGECGYTATWHVRHVARQALGLTEWQAHCLFSPRNTLADLWELAETFTGGRVTRKVAVAA